MTHGPDHGPNLAAAPISRLQGVSDGPTPSQLQTTVYSYSMKAAVVRLRAKGEKLRKDQLEEPIVGWLTVERWRLENRYEQRWVRSAILRCGPSRGAMRSIPGLNDCVLTKVDGNGFLLAGREEGDHLQDAGFPQTWWCRPISEPPEADRFGEHPSGRTSPALEA